MTLLKTIYRNTLYRFLIRPLINLAHTVAHPFILYSLGSTVSVVVTYFFENRSLRAKNRIKKGFEDHRAKAATSGTEYENIFRRIADAYNRAKEDQKKVSQPAYQMSTLWQSTLDEQYAKLNKALLNYDTDNLRTILENFSREPMSANQGGGVDYTNIRRQPLYKYLFINTWYKYYNMCQEITGATPALTYPLVGNPAGMYYDDKIIPIEALRFYYCATQIGLLTKDINHTVICEIGGGNGGQIYSVLKNTNSPVTYIDLDIPEMLVISSYFLMAALPEKRFLLYGEGEVDSNTFEQYDIVMLPHFKMPQLGNKTVDLFFNQRSFSEMDSKTVIEYLHQIERICRKYFMHINHNTKFRWDVNGDKTENLPSTQAIPNPKRFKKIYEYPWMFNRLEEEILYKPGGYIAFLYERYNE